MMQRCRDARLIEMLNRRLRKGGPFYWIAGISREEEMEAFGLDRKSVV